MVIYYLDNFQGQWYIVPWAIVYEPHVIYQIGRFTGYKQIKSALHLLRKIPD